MRILFISYSEISLSKGDVHAVAMLYALADAGHRVDLLTPRIDLPDHPHVHHLIDGRGKPVRRGALRMEALRSARRKAYDVVHAVDEAVFFALRLCRWNRIPLVYDAARRFGGRMGCGASGLSRLFPEHLQQLEIRVLERAAVVFSPCAALTADLVALERKVRIVPLEDIPVQALDTRRYAGKTDRSGRSGKRPEHRVVCSMLPGGALGLRTLFMATRKVLEAEPDTTFYFHGFPQEQAEKLAASLDIGGRCTFLSSDASKPFLSALEIADAVLMVPPAGSRYIHPQVYTLLHAGIPLVTIRDTAYDELLNDRNCVRVLPAPEAVAEGLLQVIHEPLFSLAIAMEGQQRVANRNTFSSFKHKVRMAYQELTRAG